MSGPDARAIVRALRLAVRGMPLALFLACWAGDASVRAQQAPGTPAAPPPPDAAQPVPRAGSGAAQKRIQFSGFGEVGYTAFAARDTFDAVLDAPGGPVFGGGVRVAYGAYFFQVGIERFSGDGERVFVLDGEVFRLGIPLSVDVLPIEFTGGYRFLPGPPRPPPAVPPRAPIFKPVRPLPTDEEPPPPPPQAAPRPARTWVPYVGGGIGVVRYKETSDFADAGEDVEESFTSYHVLGGIDFPVWRWVGGALEASYRWVPGAFEDTGVAGEFSENDLGGFSIRVLARIGR